MNTYTQDHIGLIVLAISVLTFIVFIACLEAWKAMRLWYYGPDKDKIIRQIWKKRADQNQNLLK